MSRETIKNVLIKDGNRTVNWDFPVDSSIRDALQLWRFEWAPDSVRINGKPYPDEELGCALVEFTLLDSNLVITMVPKKKVPKKKEVSDT